MNTILKQIIELSDAELYSLSDAVDAELDRHNESVERVSGLGSPSRRGASAELSPTRRFLGAAGEGRRFRQVAQSAPARPELRCANRCCPQLENSRENEEWSLPPTTNRSFCRFGTSITTTRRERAPEPDVPRDGFDSNKDEYWAGRIFAMRRSARVAA